MQMAPEHAANVRALINAADVDELAAGLGGMTESLGGDWTYGPLDVREALRIHLPHPDRPRLIDTLMKLAAAAGDAETRGRIHDLVLSLIGGLGVDVPATLVDTVLERTGRDWHARYTSQLSPVVAARLASGVPLSDPALATLRRTALLSYMPDTFSGLMARVEGPLLNPGEAWADQAMADATASDAATGGDVWLRLLTHALTAQSSKPTANWEAAGRDILAEAGVDVGVDAVAAAIVRWLDLVGHARTLPVLNPPGQRMDFNTQYDPYNVDALRGLAWLLALTPESPESARSLGRLAETALRKTPGIGPVSPKVANAAVYALSRHGGEASVAQLARLATKLKYRGTLKEIAAALDARAAALGISRAEVEEMAVPGYGLTEVGRRVERLGAATAELTVSGTTVALSWRNAAGRTVKSPPADVRRDHAAEVAELKACAKDIAKMLAAQSERLDRQFAARRTWRFGQWRERLLDHPLVGTLARRLLWTVDGRVVGFADGALRTLDDEPIAAAGVDTAADSAADTAAGADAVVDLWHPVESSAEEITAAREWLERHTVTQPFRQAHRELYPLTAAEETTGNYSNRYAAHVLRQHQFHALAAARGWTNKLRLPVDDSYPPAIRALPEWGLRAEFWIAAGEDEALVESPGPHAHVITDQVRFYPIDAPGNRAHASGGPYSQQLGPGSHEVAPLPLHTIPPLVFSEVMRDIDLFVGVAGVGNDPTWEDGGPQGHHRNYWVSYSIGELTASAVTRRDLLVRLLPRLAIGPQCELDGKFLRVTGRLRSYTIHLGSANVLMSPHDRYLCIVPKAADGAVPTDAYLPYEGDRTLSIILSKAMLLARDDLITDPDITRQFA